MKKVLLVLLLSFVLCGCGKSELDKIIEEDDYIIVDVRTEAEYNEGHVVGSINVPHDRIESGNFDKDKTVIVYCKSGGRSKIAYDTLTKLGYDVYDLGALDSINLPKE